MPNIVASLVIPQVKKLKPGSWPIPGGTRILPANRDTLQIGRRESRETTQFGFLDDGAVLHGRQRFTSTHSSTI
jgi:hypothetical protein